MKVGLANALRLGYSRFGWGWRSECKGCSAAVQGRLKHRKQSLKQRAVWLSPLAAGAWTCSPELHAHSYTPRACSCSPRSSWSWAGAGKGWG